MGACFSISDTESSDDDSVGCGRPARSKRRMRKRHLMEVLAAEAKSNELLHRIPGRMCGNGSSSNACIFTQQGRKGINQDAMIVWENFTSRADTTFCGVFDGHGPFGHLVARKVRDTLPSKLSAFPMSPSPACDQHLSPEQEDKKIIEHTSDDTLETLPADGVVQNKKWFTEWKERFLNAYNSMDKELKTHPTIDCFCSGTTAVTVLLQGQDMIVANVGDSRAVLGTLGEDNTKVEAVQLTVDLKPNLPLEAERIKRCKGRVFALEDEPEVARVWLPYDDSPGLAMARAFGDFCLKDFGLIAVPEITYTRLTDKDQFIVLASDGIWDVLSNKEVVETVWDAPTRTSAARALVETAVRAWRLKYPTSKVDDCAVVCVYLNKQRKQAPTIYTATANGLDGEKAELLQPVEFQRSDTLRASSCDPVTDGILLSVDDLQLTTGFDSETANDDEFSQTGSPKLESALTQLDVLEPTQSMIIASVEETDKPSQRNEDDVSLVPELNQTETFQTSKSSFIDMPYESSEIDKQLEPTKSAESVTKVADLQDSSQSLESNMTQFTQPVSVDYVLQIVSPADEKGDLHDQLKRGCCIQSIPSTNVSNEVPRELDQIDFNEHSEQHSDIEENNSLVEFSSEAIHNGKKDRDKNEITTQTDDIILELPRQGDIMKKELEDRTTVEDGKSECDKFSECASTILMIDGANYASSVMAYQEAASEITAASEEEEEDGRRTLNQHLAGRTASRRSLAECLSVADEEEWSALEGEARVNSLLNLPRFLGSKRLNNGSSWMQAVGAGDHSKSGSISTLLTLRIFKRKRHTS